MFRNIAKRGLVVAFRTNRRFKGWALKVMGLPLLPADKIMDAWNELRDEISSSLSHHEKRYLAEFKRYINTYWMQGVGPHVISVAHSSRRTNNEVESFNRLLNQRARVTHPATFSYARVVANELAKTETDILSMVIGNPVRRDPKNMFSSKNAKLFRWQQMVERNTLNPMDFLTKVAKCNKKYLMLTHRNIHAHAQRMGDVHEEEPAEQDVSSSSVTSNHQSEDDDNQLGGAARSQFSYVASPAVTRAAARRLLQVQQKLIQFTSMPNQCFLLKDQVVQQSTTTSQQACIRNTTTDGLNTSQVCVVCKVNRKEAIILPCAHANLCVQCGERVKNTTCPTCRAAILSVVRMYDN